MFRTLYSRLALTLFILLCMVGVILSDIIKIIVFTSNTHAFLGIHRPDIWTMIRSEEYIFELHHSGIREKQGLVSSRDERG